MADYGETLSDREIDVLSCVAEGASNKEAASRLFISQNTVKVHLRNIYTKLGVSSRTEAVTQAMQLGLITIPGAGDTAVPPPPVEAAPPVEATPPVEAAPPVETAPPAASKSRNWLVYGAVGIVLLIVLGTAVAFGYQALNPAPPSPTAETPESFQEEAIGQTRWAVSRPLEQALSKMAAASVGLDVFHIGGETEAGVTNQVNRFDTSTKTWSEMAAKPTAVSDTTAAVLFGEIYVPGGIGEDGRPTNTVEAYSPANNAWRPIASLPKPLSGSLTVSDNSFLYSLGGWDGSQYLDDVFVYDASSDSWRPLASLPAALASAAGGIISGDIFVLGGENGTAVLDTCYVYNIETDTWDSCPAMLHPRANAGAAAILNKLYVLGGDAREDGETPFGEVYDPNTEIWQVVNTPMLENEDAWTDLGVTHVETKIYALGGKIGNTLSDKNYTYSPLVYQTFIPAAAAGSDSEP